MGNETSSPNDTQQIPNPNISFSMNFSINPETPSIQQSHIISERGDKQTTCKYGQSCRYQNTTCKRNHLSIQICKFGENCNKRDTCNRIHPEKKTNNKNWIR